MVYYTIVLLVCCLLCDKAFVSDMVTLCSPTGKPTTDSYLPNKAVNNYCHLLQQRCFR